jgi:indole-3-pyruvate monooxygenase
MYGSRALNMSRPETGEPMAIIIGAGPAGLAVGACLSRARVPFTVLEREESVAASWRHHYDRLHLHTSKGTSALPMLPFPRNYPTYPSRDQVLEYLVSYARTFGVEPHFNEEVLSARPDEGGWEVRTHGATYRAPHLVVATGLNREPVVPRWPGDELYRGTLLHSAEYQSGDRFRGKRVLVVGFGNSGMEIALDLCENGAEPTVAVRGPANVIPRDIFGIPIVNIAVLSAFIPPPVADIVNAPLLRLLIGDLRPYGIQPLPYGAMTQIARTGRIPVMDFGTVRRIKEGQIAVRPGIERFTEEGVVFTDGSPEIFDAVVLATGFRAGVNRFLDVQGFCDDHGNPLRGGRPLPEGLHLCGFTPVATGVLREIGREAKWIAKTIASARPAPVAAL